MSDFKSDQIKSVIKELLKKKKLTYEDVAEELECSVPTVKRILGPEELSLPRLLKLCELVNIDLADLDTLTKLNKASTEKFSPEQENFLAQNPHFLAYFMKLFEMTPEEIAQKYQLSERSNQKYLIGLEKQNLIHVTGKLKVKPTFRELPGFGDGPLAKKHAENFINNANRFFLKVISNMLFSADKNKDSAPGGFSIKALRATKASYTAFVKEQEKAREAFFKLASYEEKSLSEEELKTATVINAFVLVENDDPALMILEDFFGEIKNL